MALEKRLERRYQQLVRSHMSSSNFLSAGIKSTLKSSYAFAQTQGAWRFFNNERCDFNDLMRPLLEAALEHTKTLCVSYGLVAHDWSDLSYKRHHSKNDRMGIHTSQDLGYEMHSSLLMSDIHGGPIAPVAINLATKTSVLSTYHKDNALEETHLEELAKRVESIESLGFEKPLLHIVDREGDSAQLMRVLKNHKWLVRSRSNSRVDYHNTSLRVDKLAEQLTFTESRAIHYQGTKAEQYLAEGEVLITHPSRS